MEGPVKGQSTHILYMYTCKVERGCPQGLCGGPILWNMLADEALKLKLPVVCYADDIMLVISGRSKE